MRPLAPARSGTSWTGVLWLAGSDSRPARKTGVIVSKFPDLPANFEGILAEVVDPDLSIDYLPLGSRYFPVRVPRIGLEKRLLSISRALDENYEELVVRSADEICFEYQRDHSLGWAADNSTLEQMADFYVAHLEKCTYNDEIIRVVKVIIELIEWKPRKKREDAAKYIAASPFTEQFLHIHLSEHIDPLAINKRLTRGFLEIVKLNNMINNDRMQREEGESEQYSSEDRKMTEKMSSAKTLNEYMAGLASQGFNEMHL
jgi:hypothetical protein